MDGRIQRLITVFIEPHAFVFRNGFKLHLSSFILITKIIMVVITIPMMIMILLLLIIIMIIIIIMMIAIIIIMMIIIIIIIIITKVEHLQNIHPSAVCTSQ